MITENARNTFLHGRKLRGCIFDLDGTLLDTIPDIAAAMNQALEQAGFAGHTSEQYKDFVGGGIRATLLNALGERQKELDENLMQNMFQAAVQLYSSRPYQQTCPYEGVEQLLSLLEKHKVPKAVLSNKQHDLTVEIVRHCLGDWTFADVAGLQDEKMKKPDPGEALRLAQMMQIPPEAIAFVGDSQSDMKTAEAAGMAAVGVSWGFRPPEVLLQAGAEIILDTPEELLEILEFPQ